MTLTVKDLILALTKYPANAKIIIKKDVDASGYGFIDKITLGCFDLTDYGNDFYEEQETPLNGQARAVCIQADEQSWLVDEIEAFGQTIKPKKARPH